VAERKVRLACGSAILTLLVVGAISYRAAVYQGYSRPGDPSQL
jgi:hypothetical protein